MLMTGLAEGSHCRQAPSAHLSWWPGQEVRRADLARAPRVPSIPPPWLSDRQPCHGKELEELPLPTPDSQRPAHSRLWLWWPGEGLQREHQKKGSNRSHV